MVCPNCKYEMTENEALCPNCGVDHVLFVKTVRMSATLYNRGLSQAKMDDLSGAADSLTKSLEFNKNNVNARNLLGLVLFELGHIGDALKHWVISGSLLREKNPAVSYLNIIQDNSRLLEQYNDAIKMYNNALEYLQQKSDDMAIIQLKKAVEINPKFVDALNLLTLCHLIQKDVEKAKALTDRVLTMDVNNSIALSYYKEIHPAKIRPEPVQKIRKTPEAPFKSLQPKDKKNFGEVFHLTEILSFLVGCVCAFAILYVLVVPGVRAAGQDEINKLKSTALTESSAAAGEKKALEDKIEQQQEEILRLTQEVETFGRQLSVQERQQMIADAQNLFDAGRIEEAASKLSSMDMSSLPADDALAAIELQMQVYPLAAKLYYDDAVQKCGVQEYEEARASMDKCLLYAQVDVDYMDGVTFYQGRLAEADGNMEEAREFYNKVVSDYPGSTYVARANGRLDLLQE